MIIYNDFKNNDWISYLGGLPKGTIIVVNNEPYSEVIIKHLTGLGYKAYYSNKLCSDVFVSEVLDAENYLGDINYTKELGKQCTCSIIFPENLGGEKYKNYDAFLLAAKPKIVCLERTYNEWKPWVLLSLWNRNKYLRDKGIETYIGIWPETLPWICQKIQEVTAKLISGDKIFWYSETKTLPC